MWYVENQNVNPHYNLAWEEFILKNHRDRDYVLLWQNLNTVVIGRFQNTAEEINPTAVREKNISVVRRNTGGGAVYHDLGNLNFSYICDWDKKDDLSCERFLQPVIRALGSIGVPAGKSGRNDLVVDGKKISGNAQTIHKNKILHHGTILLNSDIRAIGEFLTPPTDKFESKSIKSVHSRVTTIKEYTGKLVDIPMFKQILLEEIASGEELQTMVLSEADQKQIEILADEKYCSWQWNFGESPPFNFKNRKRFSGGLLEVRLLVERAEIKSCEFRGDFLSLLPVCEIETALCGCHYEQPSILKILKKFELNMYFSSITMDEIVQCFF